MTDLCFVIMPFDEKVNAANKKIDFNVVYEALIKPAVLRADLKPIREDESMLGGIIIKSIFERIIFCDIAITDITFDNPNVYYELGIRHAVRPYTTIIICEKHHKHPFNITGLRIIEYEYDFEKKEIKDAEKIVSKLQYILIDYKSKADNIDPDSPIKLLLRDFEFPKVANLKATADEFENWVKQSQQKIESITRTLSEWKKADAAYRKTKDEQILAEQQKRIDEIKNIEETIKNQPLKEYPVLIAVLKAYKDTNSNKHIIALLESAAISSEVREKYIELEERRAHAYKMLGQYDVAEEILTCLIAKCNTDKLPWLIALLASIHKHKAESAIKEGRTGLANTRLRKAVDLYTQSFEENPNDYYPGIRLLNLLYTSELEDAGSRYKKYLPLVEFSITRRLNKNKKEYWALASKLELEVMKGNKQAAWDSTYEALDSQHAPWKRESTAKQLLKIANYKEAALKEEVSWIREIIHEIGS